MITKINIAMKNSLISNGTITVTDAIKQTPKLDLYRIFNI